MKEYVKPQLYYESFELTQHIAGNCNIILQITDPEKCVGVVDEDMNYGFTSLFLAKDICGDNTVSEMDGYCYYKFSNAAGTMNS